MPSIRMAIKGTGINYQQSGTVVSGSLSVDETGSTTSILPSGKLRKSGMGVWVAADKVDGDSAVVDKVDGV